MFRPRTASFDSDSDAANTAILPRLVLELKARIFVMYDEYWQVRANRAIVASLLHTNALLTARQQTLNLVRQTLRIQAALLRERHSDSSFLQHHHARVADYYRAYGQLLRLGRRLGSRIDRQIGYATRPSSALKNWNLATTSTRAH
jgi:hypothetical protein